MLTLLITGFVIGTISGYHIGIRRAFHRLGAVERRNRINAISNRNR
jgi:hypothetical protein